MRRWGVLAALAVTCLPAPAYYHYIHYLNGQNVREKFDLSALTNNTVTFFVSEAGPDVYNQTDSFNSVIAQIAQATQIWNGVGTSNLRVAFGGLENGSTLQNTPGSDVVFEDLAPGLYGYGGPTANLASATAADGSTFIPIVRSTVHLNRNLTILPPSSTGPSYTSTFFLTCVHEMGHALGLQHTFTSSVMSQATSRATTLSHPIDADDIAGLSILYPTPAFSQFGTIAGRITNGTAGVHLASVVAIHQGGWGAVSALTNPDGTFQIQGVPAGQYFVYAHTLPPDADIKGPWNADGSVAAASGTTNALFFFGAPGGTPGGTVGGTNNPLLATQITVDPGGTSSGINIGLSSRSSVEVYDVQIFSYFSYNNSYVGIEPAYIDLPLLTGGVVAVNAQGQGLTTPGLKAQTMLGSSISIYGSQAAQPQPGFTAVSLFMQIGSAPVFEPQHLVFTTPDYMYVLPDGLAISPNPPPTVTSVRNTGNGITVAGTNWAPDSLIYFDGLPATISALDPVNGVANVTPPVGSPGQTSVVTVYNSDGQNSGSLQSASPVTYSYGNLAQASIATISPSSLPAGAEALVDISGTGFSFTQGPVSVGFGSSDILVRRVFVQSSSHVIVDVSVSAGAALSNPDVSIVNGFQIATAPAGFQIVPAVAGLPTVVPTLTNAVAGLNGAYAGALVSIYGSNLAVSGGATPSVTIGGQAANVIYASPTQINLQIPGGLPSGPTVLALNNGALSAYPVEVNIDVAPAGINAIQNISGGYIDSTHAAHPGDQLIVTLSNFAPGGAIAANRVQVGVGGTMHSVSSVTLPVAGICQVAFQLNPNEAEGPAQQLVVYLDGRSSLPASIPVANPDGTYSVTSDSSN